MKGLAYDEIVELNKITYEKAKEMNEKFEKWELFYPPILPNIPFWNSV
jgi:hypothetical protein